MTSEQIQGIVRHVVGAFGALLIARGLADESVVVQAGGAVSTLVAIGWSVISKARR
jgi:hypothetical protein